MEELRRNVTKSVRCQNLFLRVIIKNYEALKYALNHNNFVINYSPWVEEIFEI